MRSTRPSKVRLDLELRQVDDAHQRSVEAHLLARLHMAARHLAADRRAHGGIVEQQLRLRQLRLRRLHRRGLRAPGRVGGVEGVLRNEVLLDQLRVDLSCALVLRQAGAGRLQRGRALGQLDLQRRGVELHQHLTRGDPLAFAHMHGPHLGRQLGAHGGLRHGLYRAGQCQLHRQRPRRQAHQVGSGKLQRRHFLLAGLRLSRLAAQRHRGCGSHQSQQGHAGQRQLGASLHRPPGKRRQIAERLDLTMGPDYPERDRRCGRFATNRNVWRQTAACRLRTASCRPGKAMGPARALTARRAWPRGALNAPPIRAQSAAARYGERSRRRMGRLGPSQPA
jgi:hypothetical protein